MDGMSDALADAYRYIYDGGNGDDDDVESVWMPWPDGGY